MQAFIGQMMIFGGNFATNLVDNYGETSATATMSSSGLTSSLIQTFDGFITGPTSSFGAARTVLAIANPNMSITSTSTANRIDSDGNHDAKIVEASGVESPNGSIHIRIDDNMGAASTIPEPSSLMLLGIVALLLALRRSRE
jgi:hypothetical protein